MYFVIYVCYQILCSLIDEKFCLKSEVCQIFNETKSQNCYSRTESDTQVHGTVAEIYVSMNTRLK